MPLVVLGAALGAAVAFAVATCLTGAAILASEADPLQAVTDANAFVSLLTEAFVAHVLVTVPLGALGGALAGSRRALLARVARVGSGFAVAVSSAR